MDTTALLTDRYELSMLSASLADGTAASSAVFEAFTRKRPNHSPVGVVAGIGRFLDLLDRFEFTSEVLDFLTREQVITDRARVFLDGWRFSGNIDVYRDGELYLPHSPVVTVTATVADALVLETLLLSVLNHDCTVATKAARIVDAAGGIPLWELGSRRTHEQAAVAAARACYLAGFAGTSNLQAGRDFGVPTAGTAAHAWTLVHDDGCGGPAAELEAFSTQLGVFGADTTLLVDTYDVAGGVARALEAGRQTGVGPPAAVRIDSGDLAATAIAVRDQLDAAGAADTRIIVSSDLDEWKVEELRRRGAPVDVCGVGTRVVAGLEPAGFVYKAVEVDGNPVAKRSGNGKSSVGGRKTARRTTGRDGFEHTEVVGAPAEVAAAAPDGRELQVPAVRDGVRVYPFSLEDDRDWHAEVRARVHPRTWQPHPAASDPLQLRWVPAAE